MISIHNTPATAAITSPIEHLHACHRRIEERLNTLERVAPHLLTRTDEALAALQAVFWFFDSSGVTHTADEEESFFPRLAGKLTPEESGFLEALELEHSRAEAIYDELKCCVAEFEKPPTEEDQKQYAELAGALCSLYRQHIRNEDARFAGLAARALTPDDLDAISKEMRQRRGL